MKKKNLKLSGMIVAGVIVLVSFAYAVDIQPIAFGMSSSTGNNLNFKTFESYKELTEFLNSRTYSLKHVIDGTFGAIPRSTMIDEEIGIKVPSYVREENFES